ncbi:response regulator [uncultured Flavobacterium sp.]|uniref:response regulator n=1 Tax=uncultured Flavobacterium sp. TaxID=165435 RepID=UPI0025DA0873|nr:response regulator [uncultured Flavobacterium sp.]
MQKSGTVVIIEDDADDRAFLDKILKEIGIENKIAWFNSTDEALAFLSKTSQTIFIIFSDVNLPGRNGLEFKKQIDDDPYLRKKSIPFVFYSTSANQRDVNEAYTEMTVQGFFRKPDDYTETARLMKVIFDYWSICKHPNT